MKKYGFKIYDDAKSLATFQELVAWNINVESWFLLTDLCSFLFSFSFGDQNQFLSQIMLESTSKINQYGARG